MQRVKIVTDGSEKIRIMKACHSAPTSGHVGIVKTWRRLSERFYWKGMYGDVKKLVSVTSDGDIILHACMIIVSIL